MAQDATPAIVRDYSSRDNVTVLRTPYDGVNFRRGFGESGYRVETVEHNCPECGFDRMARRHDVSPEFLDEVRYWCLSPDCEYFVDDRFSHCCSGNWP